MSINDNYEVDPLEEATLRVEEGTTEEETTRMVELTTSLSAVMQGFVLTECITVLVSLLDLGIRRLPDETRQDAAQNIAEVIASIQ